MESDNRSTLLKKLDPESLSALESAIIHRSPPTFRACFEQFDLGNKGISYSAFYRYARRLRDTARLTRLAELAEPDADSALKAIPHLVANQLVDVLTVENPSSRTVARLANAYRHFVTAQVARRRLDFAEIEHKESERRREISDLTDNYIRINRLKLADIHGDLALAKAAGLPPPANPGEPPAPRPSIPESLSRSIPQFDKQSLLDRIDLKVDAALESRLPPSLRHDPSHHQKKKHRAAAPS